MKTMLKPYKLATVAGECWPKKFFIGCPAVQERKQAVVNKTMVNEKILESDGSVK